MTISLTSQSANTSDLLTLAQWMAGDFSNPNLRKANSKQYAHIHVFRPLPFNLFYDYDLWAPYSMVFTCVGDVFRRNVESNNTWDSLDKGMDVETPEQIWGSTPEPLCFEKKQNFANSVPAVSDLC